MKRRVSWILILCLLLNTMLLCCGCTPEMVEVTFQPNNGDAVATVKVEKGLAIDTNLDGIPVPQKRACEFVGWYLNAGEETEKAWDFATDTVSEPITLTAKWKLTEDAYELDPNASVRAEGTDIRVCSYNVLLDKFESVTPDRDKGLRNMILNYGMDVIAMQEYDAMWFSAFQSIFPENEYEMVTGDSPTFRGELITSTIAYRTSTLTLLDYGHHLYLDGSGRAFSWGLFETKDESKQQFIATSTHLALVDDGRIFQATDFARQLKKVLEKYPVPVIAMGDYNSSERLPSYSRLLTETGFQDGKYTALKRGLTGITSKNGLGTDSFLDDKVNTYESIDHILCSDGIQVLYYDTIIDTEVLKTSDHVPIYADIKFAEASEK